MHKKKKKLIKKILLILWLIVSAVIIYYVCTHISHKSLFRSLRTLRKLFILVAVASFIGAIFEYRAWTKFIVFIAAPLVKLGKLSSISAVAFITAIFSNNAANTLIAGSFKEGNISRREMIVSGLCNSFPAMVSHSLRVFFPLFALVGMAAVWYYSFTFTVGLLTTITVLIISRIISQKEQQKSLEEAESTQDLQEQTDKEKEKLHKKYAWKEVLKKSSVRTMKALWRLLYITAPIYLLVGYMSSKHMFDFWKDFVPGKFQHLMTPEMMTVLSARLGGLVSAASAASEYLHSNKIEIWQIVLAFLIGNIITNPIRTLRRNLPTATGIFPGKDGLLIVLILQSVRLVTAIIAIIVIVTVFSK